MRYAIALTLGSLAGCNTALSDELDGGDAGSGAETNSAPGQDVLSVEEVDSLLRAGCDTTCLQAACGDFSCARCGQCEASEPCIGGVCVSPTDRTVVESTCASSDEAWIRCAESGPVQDNGCWALALQAVSHSPAVLERFVGLQECVARECPGLGSDECRASRCQREADACYGEFVPTGSAACSDVLDCLDEAFRDEPDVCLDAAEPLARRIAEMLVDCKEDNLCAGYSDGCVEEHCGSTFRMCVNNTQ
jgi:hypothetical protein